MSFRKLRRSIDTGLTVILLLTSFSVHAASEVKLRQKLPNESECESSSAISSQDFVNAAFLNFSEKAPLQGQAERPHPWDKMRALVTPARRMDRYRQLQTQLWIRNNLQALRKATEPTRVGQELLAPQPNAYIQHSTVLNNVLRGWREVFFWNPYLRQMETRTVSALPFIKFLIEEKGASHLFLGDHNLYPLQVALIEKDYESAEYLAGLAYENIPSGLMDLAVENFAPVPLLEKLSPLAKPTVAALFQSLQRAAVPAFLKVLELGNFSPEERNRALWFLLDHRKNQIFFERTAFYASPAAVNENPSPQALFAEDSALHYQRYDIAAALKLALLNGLLEHGAQVNAANLVTPANSDGNLNTALHVLLTNPSPRVNQAPWYTILHTLFPRLLEAHADVNLENLEGRNALAVALNLDTTSLQLAQREILQLAELTKVRETITPAPLVDDALKHAMPWSFIEDLKAKNYRPTPKAVSYLLNQRSTRSFFNLEGLQKFFQIFPDAPVDYAAMKTLAGTKFGSPPLKVETHLVNQMQELFSLFLAHGAPTSEDEAQNPELLQLLFQDRSMKVSRVEIARILVEMDAPYGIGATLDKTPALYLTSLHDPAALLYLLSLTNLHIGDLDALLESYVASQPERDPTLPNPVTLLALGETVPFPDAILEKIRAKIAEKNQK